MNSNTPLDVCYYCSSVSFGGLEMNIVRLLRWLKDAGYNVRFLVAPDSPLEKFALEEGLDYNHIEVNKKYFDFKRAKAIGKLLKQQQVKLLLVGATRDVAFCTLIKRLYYRKLMLIYHSQMQIGISKRGLIHTLRYKMLEKWIVTLPYLKKEVGVQTRFPVERTEVVPLCIDTAYFINFTKSQPECRKELKLPEDIPLIGILGRIDPQKRQDFLVHALDKLHRQNVKAGLVIMGESTRNTSDEYYINIKKSISNYDLDDYVFFLPFSKEIRPFYRAIDVFAMTTIGETFGMVTIEAMANQTPVLACNSGGSIEILEHGKLGSLFDKDNVDDFCAKYIQMKNNIDKTNEIAKVARKTAIEKYDKKVMVDAFIQLMVKYIN